MISPDEMNSYINLIEKMYGMTVTKMAGDLH
jgi:hypothetical protein